MNTEEIKDDYSSEMIFFIERLTKLNQATVKLQHELLVNYSLKGRNTISFGPVDEAIDKVEDIIDFVEGYATIVKELNAIPEEAN